MLKPWSARMTLVAPSSWERKAGRKLMVAYRCRYEPYNREAIRIARSHELGATKVILADHGFNIGDPTQWRLKKDLAGGGSLMDIGIYSLQAARYLSGEEPNEVNAVMYNTPGDPRFKEVEEDRKSTRLNSSHSQISYAVFCLHKKSNCN